MSFTTSRNEWAPPIVRFMLAACMAAVLGACGEESPGSSSPTPSASASRTPMPTNSVDPSPKEVAPSPTKRAAAPPPSPSFAALRPGKCVAAAAPTSPAPTLDRDVCQAVVGYTRRWVDIQAKVDPTSLALGGMSFRGYFDAPSSKQPGENTRFWQWAVRFPLGVQEARQFSVFNRYGGLYGCGPQGMGRGYVPTATVNREQGIIKAAFPGPCISQQGIDRAPKTIRASVSLDPIGTPYEGAERAYFTALIRPGEVAVLRR